MELFRKAFCAAAAAFIVAGCSVKEQFQEEDQGRKYYGSINVELSYGVTRSSLQTGPDGKSVVWDMSDKFRIYNVADASFVEVSPSSISSDGFTATLPLPYPTGKDISMVVTYGGTEFRSDSTVTAASPIEQGLYTEGHNCNAMPMASSIIPLVSDTPSVTLTPLGALVEVEFLRIPNSRTDKIRNIHILTKAVRGTRSNQLTCDAYCYKVGLDGFSLELEDYMSDKYVFDGEYTAYLELTSAEPVSYSTSLTSYFLSPGYVQPEGNDSGTILQEITVQITTDQHIITKSFTDLDSRKVKFTAGRITRFALSMATAEVKDRLGFSVVWSPGYLKYDASTRGYGFAGPEERGLFFKIGSVMGFDPFASTPAEEYFGHSRPFVGWQYDMAGNISYTDYYKPSWEEGTTDMVAYRKDDSGDIVPFTPTSYEDFDYAQYAEGLTFDPARHDPCRHVKDGNSWRLPTEAEMLNLADVINENLGNWRVWSLGSTTINTLDNKPHMIGVTDKSGNEVILSTTSTIDHANSPPKSEDKKGYYKVELAYSESIYFPSSEWRSEMKSTGIGAVDCKVFAVTSLTSLRCNYECDPRTYYSNSANALRQSASMVRCVRNP